MKNKIYQVFCAVGLVCFSQNCFSNNKAYNLVDIYRTGLVNDRTIKIAEQEYKVESERLPQSVYLYVPKINLEGNYGYGAQDSTTTDHQLEYYPNNNISLSVTQPIVNVQALISVNQANHFVKQAQLKLDLVNRDYKLRVAKAYFSVLAAQESLAVSLAENETLKQSLDNTNAAFELGTMTISDKLDTRARYDISNARVLETKNAVLISLQELKSIIGEVPPRLLPLKENANLPKLLPLDLSHWETLAINNNLETQLGESNLKISKLDLTREKAGFSPTLNLVGTASYGETSNFFFGERKFTSYDAKVLLNLNIPITGERFTYSKVREARHANIAQRERLAQTKERVELDVRRAFLSVSNGLSQTDAYKRAVISSETALQASRDGLAAGVRTQLDVLDSQQQLYRAQRDYAISKYEYLLNYLQLKGICGALTEDDIVDINMLLQS